MIDGQQCSTGAHTSDLTCGVELQSPAAQVSSGTMIEAIQAQQARKEMRLLASVSERVSEAWSSSPRARTVLVAGGAVLLCVWQCCTFHAVRQDDPFITYRYGQNLVNGNGLVFNPGERFLGATSPAHMLLAAAVYWIFNTTLTPTVVDVLSCVAWSVQAAVVFALVSPIVGSFHALLVALVVDLGGAESFNWLPFETNLAMAFAMLSLLTYRQQRPFLTGVALAIGALFRPEIVLLAALVFCTYLPRKHKQLLAACTPFLVLVGGWAAFAFAYYGSALPHSAVEKFQRTQLDVYLEHAWRHVGEVVLPFGTGAWRSLVAWPICVLGAVLISRGNSALRLLALFSTLHLLCFALVLRPFTEHTWHLYPSVFGAVVCAAGGLAWTGRLAPIRLLRLSCTGGLCILLVGIASRSVRAAADVDQGYWTGARHAAYSKVAQHLREQRRETGEFASIEVGTIAYYSDRSAYDLGGLVTDLRTDPMARHPVRWVVLDKRYLYAAPPWPPAYVANEGNFGAYVYKMPGRFPSGRYQMSSASVRRAASTP
jgi:hypothetical protein